jgi:hypothetical protein
MSKGTVKINKPIYPFQDKYLKKYHRDMKKMIPNKFAINLIYRIINNTTADIIRIFNTKYLCNVSEYYCSDVYYKIKKKKMKYE